MSYPRRLIPIAAGLAAALWLGAPSGALAQTLDCDDVGTVDNDVCQVSGSLVIGPGEVLELDIDLDVEEDLTIETGGTIRFIDGPPKSLTVGGDLEIQESGTLSSAGDNGTSGANSSTAPGNGQLGTDGLDLDVRVGGSAFIDGHVSAAGGAGGRGGNATGNATSGRGVDAGNGRNGASGGTLTFHVDLDAVIGPTASISTDGGAGGAGGNGQNTASSATGTGGNGGSGGDGGGAGGLSFTVCGVLDVEAEGDLAALLTASGGNGGNGGSGGTGRGSGNFGGNGGNGGDGGDGNDVELHADGDVTIAGSVIAVGGAAGDGGNRGNGASGASQGSNGAAGETGADGSITISTAQEDVNVLDATFIPDELDLNLFIVTDAQARCGNGPEPAGIDFEAVSQTTFSNPARNNLAVNVPDDADEGDLLLAQVLFLKGSDIIIPTPAGWTLVVRTNRSSDIGSAIYRKFAGPAEPTSYTWAFSEAVAAVGGMLAYSGVDTTNPIVASNGIGGDSLNLDAPSIAAEADSWLVAFFGIKKRTTLSTPTIPSTTTLMNRRYYQANTGDEVTAMAADQADPLTNPTGTRRSTASDSALWVAQSVTLRAAQ